MKQADEPADALTLAVIDELTRDVCGLWLELPEAERVLLRRLGMLIFMQIEREQELFQGQAGKAAIAAGKGGKQAKRNRQGSCRGLPQDMGGGIGRLGEGPLK